MSPRVVYVSKRFGDERLAVIAQANEILREYEEQGYDLTLRQLYYQFVARGLIANSDREYHKLGSTVNDARLAGKIDWHAIVDRTRYLRRVSTWADPGAIVRGAARGYQIDLWATQEARVEVWVEKDALVGVIERACEDLRVPFLSCRGYTSQSEMWNASQRFYDHTLAGKHVHVLHLGDHDPSGIDMSRDIEDRIRMFMATDYFHADGEIEAEAAVEWTYEWFTLDRLALNWDQVQQYNPPPNPAKLTDSRGRGYIAEYGRQSWELDALEPTVIGALIRDAVAEIRDQEAWDEMAVREEREREHLTAAAERWPEVVQFLDDTEPDLPASV